jgi:hypothetical protein
MYLNETLKEITILLVLIRNGKNLFFVDKLVLIEEGIGDDGHIELLIILIFDILVLVIVLMVNLQEAKRI